MENNLKILIEKFEENKGQFVIMGNSVVRLVCIAEDDMDYYYVTYDGRKAYWHSALIKYIPLKGKIDDGDYNELIRIAKLNHYDQEGIFDPVADEEIFKQRSFSENHKENIMKETENDRYLAPFCWDMN